MILVGVGDSWAFGAELYDITVDRKDLGHQDHFTDINKKWRKHYRYLGVLARKFNAKETVDLTVCAASNNRILRDLITWLVNNGYTTGKDTSELFISIGWTSPERTDFYYKQIWGGDNFIDMGPHVHQDAYKNHPEVGQFQQLYLENFNELGGVFHRWINQITYIELFLKKYNIKYVMHQAFYQYYQHLQVTFWDDDKIKSTAFDQLTLADKNMWEQIDKTRFINKNDPVCSTAHHYIMNQVSDKSSVFYNWHPNELGHKLWGEYMYQYCLDNKLVN
jgi:hypothetical protein